MLSSNSQIILHYESTTGPPPQVKAKPTKRGFYLPAQTCQGQNSSEGNVAVTLWDFLTFKLFCLRMLRRR